MFGSPVPLAVSCNHFSFWSAGVMRAATALQKLLSISADCDPLWVRLHDHSVTLSFCIKLAKGCDQLFPQHDRSPGLEHFDWVTRTNQSFYINSFTLNRKKKRKTFCLSNQKDSPQNKHVVVSPRGVLNKLAPGSVHCQPTNQRPAVS